METPQNSLNSALFAKTVLRWQGVNFGSVSKNPNAHMFMETEVTKKIRIRTHWAAFAKLRHNI